MALKLHKETDTEINYEIRTETALIDNDDISVETGLTNQEIEDYISNKLEGRGYVDLTPVEWM